MLGKGVGPGNWSGRRPPIIQPPVDIVAARGYDQYPVVPLSRATTATYVDADGTIKTAAPDAPRFDWSTGQRALLVEAAATNLINIPFSAWVNNSNQSTISTSEDALGGASGIEIEYDGSSNSAGVYRFFPIVAAPYTFSVFVRWVSGSTVWKIGLGSQLFGPVSERAYVTIDVTTGTLHSAQSGVTAYTFTALGNGWARISVSAVSAVAGNCAIEIYSPSSHEGHRCAQFSCAQLEAGAAPTSYIPTAGSAVTRAADIASPIDLSGFDLSGGYTAVVKGRLDGVAGAWDRLIQLDAGTNANRQSVVYNRAQSRLRAEVWSGNAASSMTEASAPLPFEARCAFAIAPDSFDYAQNGVVSPHDDTVVYVQPSWMRLGVDISGAQTPARLLIYSVTLYPAVMTAAQLEEITA